jgi:hypothetical protein
MVIAKKLEDLFKWAMKDKPNYDMVLSDIEYAGLSPFITRKLVRYKMKTLTLFTKEENKFAMLYLPFDGNGKFVKDYAEYEEKLI